MQQVANFYKELPEVAYKKVSLPEGLVVAHINTLDYNTEVKRTVFAVSYNETGGYQALVNTNAAGFQGDNARWSHRWDNIITATTVKRENMTGNARRFLVFSSWQRSVEMLAYYMHARGIYIGGNAGEYAGINPVGAARTVTSQATTGQQPSDSKLLLVDLYTAYLRAWVLGDASAQPKLPDMEDFTFLYNRASKFFI
jgi:hypothetical protein